MSKYGVIGYSVTVAVVVKKTYYVGSFDEDVAIEEAINGFTITNEDWDVGDLEITDVEPDYFDT